MVAGMVCSNLIFDYQNRTLAAATKAQQALNIFHGDCLRIWDANKSLAAQIESDPQVISAFAKRDRKAASDALNNAISKTAFPGFLALIDRDGKVFFSTETPKLFDYSVFEKASGLDNILDQHKPWNGFTISSPSGYISASYLAPLRLANDNFLGTLAVCQPFNPDFLDGMSAKLPLQSDAPAGVGIVVLPAGNSTAMVATPNVMALPNNLVRGLNTQGVSALPHPPIDLKDNELSKLTPFPLSSISFQSDGRWWIRHDLTGAAKNNLGVLLIGVPIGESNIHVFSLMLTAAGIGFLCFLCFFKFMHGIAFSVTSPLHYLKQRAFELTQKEKAPPLEGLEGEWLQLGELIDTAVSNSRSTMQSLRAQLNKQMEGFEEKSKRVSECDVQLEMLNRQFSQQARQLAEVAKQTNFAIAQSMLLQKKLDAVMQASTEGYLVLDQFGNVLNANPTFLNWIGAAEGEIAGRFCFDLVLKPGEPHDNLQKGQSFARRSGDPQELIHLFYPDGIIFNNANKAQTAVLTHLQPIEGEDASIQGYVMVLRDKSLRSEIAHLRSEIVAMLSESIRSPIAQSESQWQSILQNAANKIPPSINQTLVQLHQNYENLLAVIDSLLMMYGNVAPANARPRAEIVIGRLVAECLEEVAPLARERQLSLDYKCASGLPNLTGEKELLKSIAKQLLEKMISITGAGGRVRVESLVKGSDLRLGVLSSGPALSDQEIADMFIGFVEGRHDADTYSDRLMMYLARNNVERLGGKIWAESDRGTAVYFILPLH